MRLDEAAEGISKTSQGLEWVRGRGSAESSSASIRKPSKKTARMSPALSPKTS